MIRTRADYAFLVIDDIGLVVWKYVLFVDNLHGHKFPKRSDKVDFREAPTSDALYNLKVFEIVIILNLFIPARYYFDLNFIIWVNMDASLGLLVRNQQINQPFYLEIF